MLESHINRYEIVLYFPSQLPPTDLKNVLAELIGIYQIDTCVELIVGNR
jgi:hypothetical protein